MKGTIPGICLLILLLAGCTTTHRINHFQTFSEAGKSYTEAIMTLSEEAGRTAIQADSVILLQTANDTSAKDREMMYGQQTDALRNLLNEIQRFQIHCNLLNRYFIQLKILATVDSSELNTVTSELISELNTFTGKQLTIRGVSVQEITPNMAALTIGHFTQQALQKELNNNASMIANELNLQEKFLTELAAQLESDINVLNSMTEYNQVMKPYIDGKIPDDWIKIREQLLSNTIVYASAQNAKVAAQNLKHTFVRLVEGKITDEDFESLFGDIDAILDLVEILQKGTAM